MKPARGPDRAARQRGPRPPSGRRSVRSRGRAPPASRAPRRSRTRSRVALAHGISRWNGATVTRFGRRGRQDSLRRAANPAEAVSAAAHALPRRELVLDRYRPLRPLGSGGSGSVWLARDEQTGLDVALKIVPREGKAARPRRARGRGRVAAAPRALPARLRLRRRLGPRLHRLRVRRRPHAARRDARRRAARRPGGRGGGADPRRPRARARARDRPPRRQAVERPARRGRRRSRCACSTSASPSSTRPRR